MDVIHELIGNDRTNYDTICTHKPVTQHLSSMSSGPVIIEDSRNFGRVRIICFLWLCIGLGDVSRDQPYWIRVVVKPPWSSLDAGIPEDPQ